MIQRNPDAPLPPIEALATALRDYTQFRREWQYIDVLERENKAFDFIREVKARLLRAIAEAAGNADAQTLGLACAQVNFSHLPPAGQKKWGEAYAMLITHARGQHSGTGQTPTARPLPRPDHTR